MIKMWFEMYTVFTNSIFFFRVELTGKRARTHAHARAQSHPHSLQSPTHSDAYSITSQKTRKHYQDAID